MGRRRGPANAMPMLELAAPLNFYEADAGWAWSAEQQGWDGRHRQGHQSLNVMWRCAMWRPPLANHPTDWRIGTEVPRYTCTDVRTEFNVSTPSRPHGLHTMNPRLLRLGGLVMLLLSS